MLSKNQVKFIRSLKKKKFREANQLFIAEGIKVVEELIISPFVLHKLYGTAAYQNPHHIADLQLISEQELGLISDFSNPNQVLAVFEIPKVKKISNEGLTVVLDSINDPGNLGTIIRLCDWFGVTQLVCSENTVDCYNQKVVQASMGSLSRISIHYVDIEGFLKDQNRPVYGTFLEGKNIYDTKLNPDALIVLGNEANGISNAIEEIIEEKITIPQFGENHQTESLNVATATAIVLSEFKRQSKVIDRISNGDKP